MKEHRQLRELLGAHALGHLTPAQDVQVRAHLDGCADCRAELAEIAPLADDLAGVDPERVTTLVSPPADLGARIRAAVADERRLVDARTAAQHRREDRSGLRRALLTTAAGIAVLGAGTALGASLSEGRPAPAPAVAVEQLALVPAGDDAPDVQSAGLVAHTWGVEVKLVATGFRAGEVYRAAVRTDDGALVPAGEFLGVGDRSLTCNLQAALLRPDATGFVVRDADGDTVLETAL